MAQYKGKDLAIAAEQSKTRTVSDGKETYTVRNIPPARLREAVSHWAPMPAVNRVAITTGRGVLVRDRKGRPELTIDYGSLKPHELAAWNRRHLVCTLWIILSTDPEWKWDTHLPIELSSCQYRGLPNVNEVLSAEKQSKISEFLAYLGKELEVCGFFEPFKNPEFETGAPEDAGPLKTSKFIDRATYLFADYYRIEDVDIQEVEGSFLPGQGTDELDLTSTPESTTSGVH